MDFALGILTGFIIESTVIAVWIIIRFRALRSLIALNDIAKLRDHPKVRPHLFQIDDLDDDIA